MFDEHEASSDSNASDPFVQQTKAEINYFGRSVRTFNAIDFTPFLQAATGELLRKKNLDTKVENVVLSVTGTDSGEMVMKADFDAKGIEFVGDLHMALEIKNDPLSEGSLTITKKQGKKTGFSLVPQGTIDGRINTAIQPGAADEELKGFLREKFGNGNNYFLSLIPGEDPKNGEVQITIVNPNFIEPEHEGKKLDSNGHKSHDDGLQSEAGEIADRFFAGDRENISLSHVASLFDEERFQELDNAMRNDSDDFPISEDDQDELIRIERIRSIFEARADKLLNSQFIYVEEDEEVWDQAKEALTKTLILRFSAGKDAQFDNDELGLWFNEVEKVLVTNPGSGHDVNRFLMDFNNDMPWQVRNDAEKLIYGSKIVQRLDAIMALLPDFVEDLDLSQPNAVNIRVQSRQKGAYELLRNEAPTALREFVWQAGRMEGSGFVKGLSGTARDELDSIRDILVSKYGFDNNGDSPYLDLYRIVSSSLNVDRSQKRISGEILNEIREFADQNGMSEPLPPDLEQTLREQFGDIFDVEAQNPEKQVGSVLSHEEIMMGFINDRETIQFSVLATLYDNDDYKLLNDKFNKEGDLDGEEKMQYVEYHMIRELVKDAVGDMGLMGKYFLNKDNNDEWNREQEKLIDLTLRYYSNDEKASMALIAWFTQNSKRFGVVSDKNFANFFQDLTIDNPWADEAGQISFHSVDTGGKEEQGREVLKKFIDDATSKTQVVDGILLPVTPSPDLPADTPPIPDSKKTEALVPEKNETSVQSKVEVKYKKEPKNIANYRSARENLEDALRNYDFSSEQLAEHLIPGRRIRLSKSTPAQKSTEKRVEDYQRFLNMAVEKYQEAFVALPKSILNKGYDDEKVNEAVSKIISGITSEDGKGISSQEWLDFLTEFDKLLPKKIEITSVPGIHTETSGTIHSNEPVSKIADGVVVPDTKLESAVVEDVQKREDVEIFPEVIVNSEKELRMVSAWLNKYMKTKNTALPTTISNAVVYELTSNTRNAKRYANFNIEAVGNEKSTLRKITLFFVENGVFRVGSSVECPLKDLIKKIQSVLYEEQRKGSWDKWSGINPDEKYLEALAKARVES